VVHLPASRLGIHFCGNPPIFIKIAYDSLFRGKVLVGMAINTLEIPGGPAYMQRGTGELVQLFQDSCEMEDHVLTLKNTITTMMTKKPDEVEVSLPPGSFGASFKRTPPKVTRFSNDFQERDKIQIGLVIDKLILKDGTTYAGLYTAELTKILANNASSSDHLLILKNPATQKLSKKIVHFQMKSS
jgi:hypothetical protein